MSTIADLIWAVVGFLLTVLIFSYLFGDNVLFRLASYLFVGVSAGYASVLIVYQVLLPRLVLPLLSGTPVQRALLVIPLVLSLLLIFKLAPRFTRLGSLPMAYLVGVGAAVLLGGVVLGTLVGQVRAATDSFNLTAASAAGNTPLYQLFESLVFLLGTISALVYFQFGALARPNQPAQRPPLVESVAKIGQVFIAITLGALFAGVFATTIAALVDRVDFIANLIQTFSKLLS
jgi:hypothetical protein